MRPVDRPRSLDHEPNLDQQKNEEEHDGDRKDDARPGIDAIENQNLRGSRGDSAEEVSGVRTKSVFVRHFDAGIAPVLYRPEWICPFVSEVRTHGSIELPRLEFAPPSFEEEPGKRTVR